VRRAPEREAELRAFGLPQDAIELYLAKEQPEHVIEVLEENWDAVRVYRLCQWDTQQAFVMSMGGGVSRTRYARIQSTEIESVCRALDVRYDEPLLVKVQILADEAATVLNGS
jgi:hypothetical protein